MKTATSRVLLVVFVAALIAMAGCGADQGEMTTGTTTGTTTQVPTETPTLTEETITSKTTTAKTTTQANSSESEGLSYPTGFSGEGYQNSTLAIQQHTQVLSTLSFTSATVYDTPALNSTIILAANSTNERVYMEVIRDGSVVQQYYFANGSRHSRQRADGSLEYSNQSMTFARALVFDGQYENIAGATLSSPNLTETNQSTLYRFPVVDQEGVDQNETSGNLTILSGGLIPEYEIVSSDTANESVVKYQLTKIGSTTVAKPDWVTQNETTISN